jgi:hypothetical protein
MMVDTQVIFKTRANWAAAILQAISIDLPAGTNVPLSGHRTKKHQSARSSGVNCCPRRQSGFLPEPAKRRQHIAIAGECGAPPDGTDIAA